MQSEIVKEEKYSSTDDKFLIEHAYAMGQSIDVQDSGYRHGSRLPALAISKQGIGLGDEQGFAPRLSALSVWHVNTRPFAGAHFATFP
jgi:hypothetical protein